MCALGCIAIPFGENVKVSFQLLLLFVIFSIVDKLIDKILIVGTYIILGLFLPIYAGFVAGLSPTFGFLIGFLLSSIPFHFIYKIHFKHEVISFVLACVVSTIIIYLCGSIFLSLYLKTPYFPSLLVSVVPYIPFDIAKIFIAYFVVKLLKPLKH